MYDHKISKKFLSLCDNGFAVIQQGGAILEVNKALCELTDRTEEELLSYGIDILFDSFSVEQILKIYNAFECQEISHTISGDLLRKNAPPRFAEIHINCTNSEQWLLIKNKSFRREMEDKLRRSKLMLKTTLESLPFDFWINDPQNRTWMQNSYSKALWGDVKGCPPEEVGADSEITDNWLDTTSRALKGEVVEGEIEYNIEGQNRIFRNIIAPIRDEDEILGILGMNIDITDLKEALKAREMLLKEVHHRVKNNLQMISSIINLEAAGISDEVEREVFNDLVSRIEAISLVHEKLYRSDLDNLVGTADYIRDLVDHLVSGVRSGDVMVDYDLDDIDLGIDRIIILGLIINELVTNSIKYAFSGEGRHILRVSVKKQSMEITAVVSDNGPGIPENDRKRRDTLGFRMIDVLSNQLGGVIKRSNCTEGCRSELVFPVNK